MSGYPYKANSLLFMWVGSHLDTVSDRCYGYSDEDFLTIATFLSCIFRYCALRRSGTCFYFVSLRNPHWTWRQWALLAKDALHQNFSFQI